MTMRPEDCERRPFDVARLFNALEDERDTLQRKLDAMIAVVDSRGIQLDDLRAKLRRAVEAMNDAERMIDFGHRHAGLSGRAADFVNAAADAVYRLHAVLVEIGEVPR